MDVEAFPPRPGVGELRQHEAQPLVAQQQYYAPVQQPQQAFDHGVDQLHVQQGHLPEPYLPGALAHQLRQQALELAPSQVGALDEHHVDQRGQRRVACCLEQKAQAAGLTGLVDHQAQHSGCLLGGFASVATGQAQVLRRNDEGTPPSQ